MSLFDAAGATDIGKVRENNEDSYVICNGEILIAAVADGIGGHAHGEIASMLSCVGIAEKFKAFKFPDKLEAENLRNTLANWIEDVNRKIFERNKAEMNPLPMGSTLCTAIFAEDFTICGNVGDSRLYCLADGKLKQLTRDHTVLQQGMSLLCRAMGIAPKARPETFIFDAALSDCFILMSDGIYNSISENDIADILKNSKTARMATDRIIECANQNGGVDNLTVITVFRKR